uniref:Transmembrane protein n=1 Tax=Caenorhabditis japonica TaxID=281687 RepID=A0A8R1E6K4_CAEJA
MEESDEKDILSLFEKIRNETNQTSESNYSIAGALLLSGKWMSDWWEISLSIFLWMAISFMIISTGASLLALFTLRKHPYACFIPIPFIIMMFIIPSVFGAPTSMVLAFAMSASKNAVSTWYCAVMGIIQTILIFVTSLTRIHATL